MKSQLLLQLLRCVVRIKFDILVYGVNWLCVQTSSSLPPARGPSVGVTSTGKSAGRERLRPRESTASTRVCLALSWICSTCSRNRTTHCNIAQSINGTTRCNIVQSINGTTRCNFVQPINGTTRYNIVQSINVTTRCNFVQPINGTTRCNIVQSISVTTRCNIVSQ